MIYADTSFLIALYLPEEGSNRVLNWMQRTTDPVPFTPLHRHELRTGMRQRVHRGELTIEKLKEALAAVEADLKDNILVHTPIPWTESFREAERIGEEFGAKHPIRSLDLLHVGISLALNSEDFLTLDRRQKDVARLAGFASKF